MNLPSNHNPVCSPDCRYRSLYEGSQTSLSDMARRQAQALVRVGHLRDGIIAAMRRNFSKQFREAEVSLGHRFSEVDDEILLVYMASLMTSAPGANPTDEEGLNALRIALQAKGINLPGGGDLKQWAKSVEKTELTSQTYEEDLSSLFAQPEETKISVPQKPQPEAEQESAPQPRRRTLQSLREEYAALEKTPTAKIAPSKASRKKPRQDEDDLSQLFSEVDETVRVLPPANPYAPVDTFATTDFDNKTALKKERPERTKTNRHQPENTATKTEEKETQNTPKVEQPRSLENKPAPTAGEERPLSKSALRRKRKAEREAAAKQAQEEQLPPADLSAAPAVMKAPWGNSFRQEEVTPELVEENLPSSDNTPEINLPDDMGVSEEFNVPFPDFDDSLPFPEIEEEIEESSEESFEVPFAEINLPLAEETSLEEEPQPASVETETERPSLAQIEKESHQEESDEAKTFSPMLRPTLFPQAARTSTRARRGTKKAIRTTALSPSAQIPDIIADVQTGEGNAPLDETTRNALMAMVCTPRPVFSQDLEAIAGSRERVSMWENEMLKITRSPLRVISAKARHRLRGNLILPYDYAKDASNEFKRSTWAECMERYRGPLIYEVGVLLSQVNEEIIAAKVEDQTLTLRLNTRAGLVGVVVALQTKLKPGEITRNAVTSELETLLKERLSMIAVLSTRAETLEPLSNAVVEESQSRNWAVATPIIATHSWDYAQNRGATANLLLGG